MPIATISQPSLRRLLIVGHQPGGRVPLSHGPVEDAQSESPAISLLIQERGKRSPKRMQSF
jgi:hypothetical protein